jgi:hypothetical protein
VTESVAPTPHPDLKIISSRVFRGPNIWHYEPAIQLVVDLGVLEDFPTNKLPGFAEALLERLPGLMNHTCSRGRRGGFAERLYEGTWVGHVAEHVALQLQQTVGHTWPRQDATSERRARPLQRDLRNTEPGTPGRTFPKPSSVPRSWASAVGSASSSVKSSVTFAAGARKMQVRAVKKATFDE